MQQTEDRWSSIILDLYHYTKSELEEYAILSMMPFSSNFKRTADLEKLEFASKTRIEGPVSLPDIDTYDFSGKVDYGATEEDFNEAQQMTYSFWHEYITMNYGKSILRYEGDDVSKTTLWDAYNTRFRNKLSEATLMYSDVYPIEIWETPTTNICIYAVYRGWYYVIAEPRNK